MSNQNPGATPNKWTIANASGSPAVGNDLDGLYIKKTAAHYDLYLKIASVAQTTLPVTFEDITVDGQTWDLTVNSLPNATNAGSWVTPSQHALRSDDTPPTSGDFTAQTDGTFAPEEAAASAGQGKQ